MDIDALLDEIETESDWPEEAAPFRAIEKSLKCAICHTTMRASVLLTKCGHSFCSYCIRQSLHSEKVCPLCKKPATESDIVRNITVSEVATVFKGYRKQLLQLCRRLFNQREGYQSCTQVIPDSVQSESSERRCSTQNTQKTEELTQSEEQQKRSQEVNFESVTDSDSDSDSDSDFECISDSTSETKEKHKKKSENTQSGCLVHLLLRNRYV